MDAANFPSFAVDVANLPFKVAYGDSSREVGDGRVLWDIRYMHTEVIRTGDEKRSRKAWVEWFNRLAPGAPSALLCTSLGFFKFLEESIDKSLSGPLVDLYSSFLKHATSLGIQCEGPAVIDIEMQALLVHGISLRYRRGGDISGFGTWVIACPRIFRMTLRRLWVSLRDAGVLDGDFAGDGDVGDHKLTDLVCFLVHVRRARRMNGTSHRLGGQSSRLWRGLLDVLFQWVAARLDHFMIDVYCETDSATKPLASLRNHSIDKRAYVQVATPNIWAQSFLLFVFEYLQLPLPS
jgi:hypothetical protein